MQQRNALSLIGLLSAVVATVVLYTGQVFAFDSVPGEYLVKYKSNPTISMLSVRATASVRVMDNNPAGNLLKIRVNPVNEAQTLARLMSNPNVEYVTPNLRMHAYEAPISAQTLQDQWAIKKVSAEAAWAKAGNRGSHKVLLAVIDTGVDYNHKNLKENMVAGYNFIENNNDPMDKVGQNPGHGTHCSGIIGATGVVEGGTVGISPEVSIMPIRFLDENGSGDLNNGIKAIDYAIANHVQIISASWGATVARATAQPLIDAVKRADDAGIIFVMAAANDGKDNDSTEVFPANSGFPNTITVAASGPNDEKPNWSNYGKRTVHLAAPGLTIMSTLPGDKYGNLSGTSMATPLVAGMVAFLKAQDSTLTGKQVRALLQLTAPKVQIETACNCRVDALAAVDTLISHKMFISPAAGTIAPSETLQFEGTHGKAPFTFEVSNASVGTITPAGLFTAAGKGETTVTVKDADGQTSTSLAIAVADKDSGGGGGGGTPPGGDPGSPGTPGDCPIGDKSMCDIICQVQPDLPFCKK